MTARGINQLLKSLFRGSCPGVAAVGQRAEASDKVFDKAGVGTCLEGVVNP